MKTESKGRPSGIESTRKTTEVFFWYPMNFNAFESAQNKAKTNTEEDLEKIDAIEIPIPRGQSPKKTARILRKKIRRELRNHNKQGEQ